MQAEGLARSAARVNTSALFRKQRCADALERLVNMPPQGANTQTCVKGIIGLMILDQHSDRLRLLESATKTMFSPHNPARCLLEPPFQVESHLYQTIQAADWIATLVGRLQAHSCEPNQYADWEWAERYFGRSIRNLATHSSMWRPSNAQRKLRLT